MPVIQKPRGTRDFLPDEMEKRRLTEQLMRKTAGLWGYREVATPLFEEAELFTIRSGQGILNEMYAFEDKGGRTLALRPELTAPVLRMFVNEAKVLKRPLRWFYFSDCFRYERPQKGRYRQFWQFGAELIGAGTPRGDAEIVILAHDIIKSTGLNYSLEIGNLAFVRSLLCSQSPELRQRVMAFLDKREENELIAFLKDEGLISLFDSLKSLTSVTKLNEVFEIIGEIPEREYIESFFAILDASGVQYKLNPGIARGLDYYTGMVFEGFAEGLGAENQILGGGAYRLAHLFGGEDTSSCGFAIGFDRVMVALGQLNTARGPVVAVLLTPEGEKKAFSIAALLRAAGFIVEIDLFVRGLGSQMTHASKSADYAVIVGKNELLQDKITLKDLKTHEQVLCSLDDAILRMKTFDNS